MLRWLSRYVKQINVFGVGIELREIPEKEAQQQMAAPPLSTPTSQATNSPAEASAIVQRQDFIRIAGVSASADRVPRELDLMVDGDEIQFHIHQPDGEQRPMWATRQALQEALDQSQKAGIGTGPITIPARTSRKDTPIVLIVDEEEEIEIQAIWWIWVPKADFKKALAELGIRANW